MSSPEQAAFRIAVQRWANVANITFTETVDNQSTVGDIRIAYTNNFDYPSFGAYAYYPSSYPTGGDIWLDASDYGSLFNTVNSGSYGFLTLLHEIGHAVGLKHPFEGSDVLPEYLDEVGLTVMSYTNVSGYPDSSLSFYPTTPMWYDIMALQYIYGPNMSYHSGNDIYVFNANQDYFETIWDAGGIDTIQYVSSFQGGKIDLRPGEWSELGLQRQLFTSGGTLVSSATVNIYGTVTIESAIGGDGPDSIIGNDIANSLVGNGGADTIAGGAGDDSIEGGDGNDRLEGGPGSDRFDWDAENRAGNDTFLGGPGDDIYVLSGNDLASENAGEGTDTIWSATTFSIEFVSNVENLLLFGEQPESATCNSLNNVIWGNSASNSLTGNQGNDSLYGAGGNDTLSGGSSVDAALYTGNRATYSLVKLAGTLSSYSVNGSEGTDIAVSIERFIFADKGIALDLGLNESAGETVRIIGAAFDAPAIQQYPEYVGVGLGLFDFGLSMLVVCQRAVNAIGPITNTAFVNTVYQNVVGVLPSTATRDYYVALLQGSGGTMTQAELLMLAADADANAINVDLVGLQQSGVEFI